MSPASFKILIATCFLIALASSQRLKILGAAYGKEDVTDAVQDAVRRNSLSIRASNDVFGDSWYGNQKSLVIVYQYGNYAPSVATAAEGNTISITQRNAPRRYGRLNSDDPAIFGAAYGLADVTKKVRRLVDGGASRISAQNDQFNDSWPGVKKTLVIVYEDESGSPAVQITEEGDSWDLDSGDWN